MGPAVPDFDFRRHSPVRDHGLGLPGGGDQAVADLAMKIHQLIETAPKYYSEIAEHFAVSV